MKHIPLVAMSTDTRDFDHNVWQMTQSQYIDAAVNQAGLLPVLVPNLSTEQQAQSVMKHMNGLILTGSKTNLSPLLYGENLTDENGPYDFERDRTSFLLIQQALAQGKPILAICRGLQELNVFLGGTIKTEIQQSPETLDHRMPETEIKNERYHIGQKISIDQDSLLGEILGEPVTLVNSLHRQAIDRLGAGLMIDAVAEDGIIEAISMPNSNSFILALQWHPEYWAETDTTSKKIFSAFGDAVRLGCS